MRWFTAVLLGGFLFWGNAWAGPCVSPAQTNQFMTSHYGAHVKAVLHGQEALTFVAALNAEPPVSNEVADEVMIFERGPQEGVIAWLFLKGCAVNDYGIPRDWINKHLGAGA